MTKLMEMLIDAGYPRSEMDHHASDLYVYVTPITTQVIKEWCKITGFRMEQCYPIFKDNVTGRQMYDCAFCYAE